MKMYALQTKLNNGQVVYLKGVLAMGMPSFASTLSEALLFDNQQAAINKLSMVAFSFEIVKVG
jgi:tRNA A37 threonylcarbamoyladenosine biosynthesis protein TsaE